MAVPHPRFSFLVLIGCGLCALPTLARAQRPLSGLPAATPATVPPPALPSVPSNALPGPGATPEHTVDVIWNKADVVDILHYYEGLSGKHVLFDNSVTGQITIDVKGVTRTDAMRIIETALSLNGFTLVPGDNDIVKAVGLGKPVRPVGVPIYADLASLPDSEEIVTFMLRLSYLDPQETAGVLTQYIPPSSSIAFTPLKSANALLLTDTARSVRRLVSLIRQLDLPASPVTEKFIALQRADATKAVEFLNGVFETKSTGSTPGGAPGATSAAGSTSNTRRPIRRIGDDGQAVDIPGLPTGLSTAAGGLAVLSGDSLIQGRITLTADVRTNRVHVVTSPVNMPLVERLLQEYDADTPFAVPVRRPLRFVTAGDMLPILVDALKEQGTDNGNNPSSGSSTPSPNRSSNNNSSTGSGGFFGNSGTSSSLGSSSSGSGFSGTSGAGGSGLGDDSNAPEVDTRPTEATVGNNRLIADQRTNTIILLGGEDAKSKVFEILDQLDVRTPQVIIRTVIGELTLDNNHELGFQYLLRTNRGSLLSQFNAGQLPAAAAAASPSSTVSPTSTSALNTFSTLATGLGSSFTGVGGVVAIGKSLDLIVSALDSTDRFKTISRPMIVTSNNKRAFISSGTQVPIAENSLSSLTTSGASTGISSTTTYIPVVLKLSVTPLINSEKEVTLDIKQEINSLAGTSNAINGSSAPEISTRELQNYVTARNGETIVLGGLITQDDNQSSSDIPYLSKIPLLGNLFKAKTHDVTRNELIILMHPEVVNTAGIMADVREKEENRTYLGHDLEDQLLPNLPVRKALPVTQKQTTRATTTTTSTYVPDDKLHPAARKTSAATPSPRRTTTTTTSTDTATLRPNN